MTHLNFIRIDDKFYDCKRLAQEHPGGELFLLQCNGSDGTAMYNSSHRRRFNHDKYKAHLIEPTDEMKRILGPVHTQKFDRYFELCEKVKPVLARSGGFAPMHYYLKVALWVGCAMICDLLLIFDQERPWWIDVLNGLFFGMIGLNIQHDANHGAVSKTPIINRVLGITQDYIGGNGLGWMISHNVIHHIFCNDATRDHDLDIPTLRLTNRVPLRLHHAVQHLYFVFLEAFFGPVHGVYNLVMIWQGAEFKEGIRKALKEYYTVHKFLSFIFIGRLSLLIYRCGIQMGLFHWFLLYAAGGTYLAFFFLLSHNFDGVVKEVDTTHGCFVSNQAETSCNVGGWLLVQANGGLNYQIEHHLFPRVHHSHYPALNPIVKSYCQKQGIKYVHFPWIQDNFFSVAKHLRKMGSGQDNVKRA